MGNDTIWGDDGPPIDQASTDARLGALIRRLPGIEHERIAPILHGAARPRPPRRGLSEDQLTIEDVLSGD